MIEKSEDSESNAAQSATCPELMPDDKLSPKQVSFSERIELCSFSTEEPAAKAHLSVKNEASLLESSGKNIVVIVIVGSLRFPLTLKMIPSKLHPTPPAIS